MADTSALGHTHFFHNSEVMTFRSCEMKHHFRYREGLEPKRQDRPITFGSWFHRALETHYRDGDWEPGFKEYEDKYNELFTEEREGLDRGPEPLPSQIRRLIASYTWWWGNVDVGWKILDVEWEFEGWFVDPATGTKVPVGGRIDLVVMDPDGNIWIVDHKTTGTIPQKGSFHAMDPQLGGLYLWAYESIKRVKVAGVIYNYVLSKAPSFPEMTQGRRSKKDPDVWLEEPRMKLTAIKTDYPTAKQFLEQHQLDASAYSDWLSELSKTNEFFDRVVLPRNAKLIKNVLADHVATIRDIQRVDSGENRPTRNVTRACNDCWFNQVCRAELYGLDTKRMRSADFTVTADSGKGNTKGNDGDQASA